MENLGKQVDQMIVKSKDLTDFCNIACSEEAKAIILKGADQVKDTADLLSKCKSAIQENPKLIRTMQAALHELQRQEIIMKCILEKSNSPVRQHQPQQNYLTPTRPIPSSQAPQSSVKKIQWDKRTTSFQPPPPSTNKKAPTHINLDHFAYSLTEKEFNTIPKYLRGREHLADLQRCLDEILCPCLIDKYTLLNKSHSEANVQQRQLQRLFKDQESYFPGHYFITEGDISRFMDNLIDKRLRNRIQMLRQLGLLKEVRKNSTACYMWMIRIEGEDY